MFDIIIDFFADFLFYPVEKWWHNRKKKRAEKKAARQSASAPSTELPSPQRPSTLPGLDGTTAPRRGLDGSTGN